MAALGPSGTLCHPGKRGEGVSRLRPALPPAPGADGRCDAGRSRAAARGAFSGVPAVEGAVSGDPAALAAATVEVSRGDPLYGPRGQSVRRRGGTRWYRRSAERRGAQARCPAGGAAGRRPWRPSSVRWWWRRPAPAWTMRRRPGRRRLRTGRSAGSWRRKGSGPAGQPGRSPRRCGAASAMSPAAEPWGRPGLGPGTWGRVG